MKRLNWANRITVLRILLIAPFVICILKINDPRLTETTQAIARYFALLFFTIMAISDGVDGYLARKKGQITRLGSFLDPMADKLLMAVTCLLLATERGSINGIRLPQAVAVIIIGKDMLLLLRFMIVHFVTLNTEIVPKIKPVKIGKAATALQLLMVIFILIAPEVIRIFPGWIWFLRVLWWSAAGTAVIATLIYIREGSKYIEAYEQKDNEQN
jgi:CDP-diacylglycerol--glycerol-3-phosphate 3-phosphatidyltransferase